ncbi:MAG: FAD-dependent oxidoreductase [Gemmataceae bacterium]|nr:FAD-dependent oxidoreductase [Gemmataceae bacterium]MCI0738974.1 FAD-dependent oxidoreductase [Gemmataceae bacterium]
MKKLVHMFGNERIRNRFVRAEWRAWHGDRFSRSCYSAFPDDSIPDAREALAMPVADTLFFAGEAVGVRGKPGNVASVHGAIESGIHAARYDYVVEGLMECRAPRRQEPSSCLLCVLASLRETPRVE